MNKEKLSPVVPIVLGGNEYKLEFNLWAIGQFEELTGKNLLSGEIDSRSAKDIVRLLWAGLITHQPEFDGFFVNGVPPESVQKALRMLGKTVDHTDNLAEVSEKVVTALLRSRHVPTEESQKKEQAPA